jgi:hypothetical protein
MQAILSGSSLSSSKSFLFPFKNKALVVLSIWRPWQAWSFSSRRGDF